MTKVFIAKPPEKPKIDADTDKAGRLYYLDTEAEAVSMKPSQPLASGK